MRTIKFRAWDTLNNQMHSHKDIDNFDKDGIVHWMDIIKPDNKDGFIVMQYTGLTDKNGVEIYEGDIVKVPDDFEKYGFMAGEKRVVYFNNGSYRLKPKPDTPMIGHTIEQDDMIDCTVIGNIHQHSHLLNQ